MTARHDDRVLGIVLTFDAPASVVACLDAIEGETRPVDDVLVVDNASPEPVEPLVARYSRARVLRLAENEGPAGGYAAALERFLESDADYAWVLDDDCRPEPDALLVQLDVARNRPMSVVLSAIVDADTGDRYQGHGWLGVLLPRAVVETVGVPNAALFWWTEDTEYLQWRIPNAGFQLVWSDACVRVHRRPASSDKPAWKYYYEARNQVYHRVHVQHADAQRPAPHHLRVWVRWWRAGRAVTMLAVRSVVREPDARMRKLGMVGRGAYDGLRGRLGRTVPVDSSDRPVVAG